MKGVYMNRLFLIIAIFLTAAGLLWSLDTYELDNNGDGVSDQWVEAESGRLVSAAMDTDHSGTVDHTVRYDKEERKLYEEIDFNKDGAMDDFYYYEAGLLQRREIDSNYDGAVDVWIYMAEGQYISWYRRDTDYDGEADVEKHYGEETASR